MNTENKEWIKEFEKLWYGLRVNNQEPPSGAINVKKTLLSFISTLIEQTEARVSKLEQLRCEEMVEKARLEERERIVEMVKRKRDGYHDIYGQACDYASSFASDELYDLIEKISKLKEDYK